MEREIIIRDNHKQLPKAAEIHEYSKEKLQILKKNRPRHIHAQESGH